MGKRRDYRYWLYEYDHESSKSYLDYVTRLVRDNNIRINVLLVTTVADFEQEMKQWTPRGFDVRIKNHTSSFVMTITKIVGKDMPATMASVVKHPSYKTAYMIISDCTAEDFKNVVTKLVDKHYPVVSPIYLTNGEMRIIFDTLEKKTGLDILIESSVGKKRLPHASGQKSQVTYTKQPHSEVFSEIQSHDQWIHSMRYSAWREKRAGERSVEFLGTISRKCYFSCNRDFVPLNELIIPTAIKLASVRNKCLDVSAKSAKKKKPEPVVIKFRESVFSDTSKNQQYIDTLAELKSCSVSEYHTNPYIHVSMIDYLDGSSYDIWALAPDRLVVIPQFSASPASLRRLTNHIFERIMEGDVKKYERINVNAE